MNQIRFWEPQGGVSYWCPESGLNKVRLHFSFMLLKSGTVFQKMWDRPQLWQCLNPDWKQFYLAVHMTTESILSALFVFDLINDYFYVLWNDFICFVVILCSCKALWIALCTNCALQINLPCLALPCLALPCLALPCLAFIFELCSLQFGLNMI